MKKTAIRVGEERGKILLKEPTDLKKKHPVYYTDRKINVTDVHYRKYEVNQSRIFFKCLDNSGSRNKHWYSYSVHNFCRT